MKLAFIGLGVMGFPMAGHLQRAGHEVTVYNRTAAKSEAWAAQHGGSAALTPAAAAPDHSCTTAATVCPNGTEPGARRDLRWERKWASTMSIQDG